MDTPHELTKCSHIVAVSEHNSNRWLLQSRATQLDVTTQPFSAKTRHNDVGHPALGGRIKYESIIGEELCVRWPGTELHVAEHPLYDKPSWYVAGVRNVDITSSRHGLVASGRYSDDLRLYKGEFIESSYRVCDVTRIFKVVNSQSQFNIQICLKTTGLWSGVSLLFIEEAIFVYRWLGTKYHQSTSVWAHQE